MSAECCKLSTVYCLLRLGAGGFRALDGATEDVADAVEAARERLYFFARVVDVEAGPRAAGGTEQQVQRPAAVVARAHGNTLVVQQLAHVVAVDVAHVEGND